MEDKLIVLANKYSKKSPYYSNYPTEANWSNKFGHEEYTNALKDLISKDEALSLYVHFPFCQKQCFYCFCRNNLTSDPLKIQEFLKWNLKEIELLSDLFKKHSYKPNFKAIHFGGGSPSYMKKEDFNKLITNLKLIVDFDNLEEFALEIDPRTVDEDKLEFYYNSGVNRLSFGIQDLNPIVQKAVNRIQPLEMVEELLSLEIIKKFKSISFDLLYGLPLQTRESFRKTIEGVKKLSPDRICLYNYDHKPEVNRYQRAIKESELPTLNEKILIFQDSINSLLEDGYEFIGIDSFAKSHDSLAEAACNKNLTRNFNGVGVGIANNLIGIGPTGSSKFLNYCTQNVFSHSDYYESLKNGEFPVSKGYVLNKDDLIRREVIEKITLTHGLNFEYIEQKYDINFRDYFKRELNLLNYFIQDGILISNNNSIKVTDLGGMFIPKICSVFDKFLK